MSSIDLSTSAAAGEMEPIYLLTPQSRGFGGAVLIAVAVLWAYWPALNGGFVFDDELLLANNPMIRASDGLYRYWFTKEALDYWPITNSTFWLEWRLWGMNTTGYHATNIILHICDALMIWLVLRRLAVPWPWLAAMLFAVHPVNVESVAWITQRKNVLALLFSLLSILWWLNADGQPFINPATLRRGSPKQSLRSNRTTFSIWYFLSLLVFVAAMLSKGSVAIVPLGMLLIVWWRHGRITWHDLIHCAPFFIVAGALTAVDLWFQTHGTGDVIREATPIQRLLGAGAVIWFYLGKALLPVNLAFIYPQWDIQTGNLFWWLPTFAALAVTAFLMGKRNSRQTFWIRPVLVAWLFFCIALMPVMGFADVGYMRHSLVADHYEHIALIGVVALAATAFCFGYKKFHAKLFSRAIAAVAGIIVLLFTVLTWQQSRLYANALALFGDTVKKNPDSWIVQSDYGLELSRRGKPEEAISHFQAALRLNPACAAAHFHWGNALADLNRPLEAIDHYRQAIKEVPNYAEAHYRLGMTLQFLDRPEEAEQEYHMTLESKPDHAEVHNSLGLMLAARKQFLDAVDHFQQAVEANPEYLPAYINLASACAALGRYSDAVNFAQQALKIARSNNQLTAGEGIEARLKFYQDRVSGGVEKEPADASAPKP
jgi:tetratricopeptide (TPR) repeat protein